MGSSICEFVRETFTNGHFSPNMNETIIKLIPKLDHPDKISQFQPIFLCNVVAKCIIKIIANKLKPLMTKLIGEPQSSFVPRRHGVDNIVLVQEIIHSMKIMKGQKGWMAVKLDLEKAYDRIE